MKVFGKEIEVLKEIPDGWAILYGATTAPVGYKWIWNKKSRFFGEYKHALIKIYEKS